MLKFWAVRCGFIGFLKKDKKNFAKNLQMSFACVYLWAVQYMYSKTFRIKVSI